MTNHLIHKKTSKKKMSKKMLRKMSKKSNNSKSKKTKKVIKGSGISTPSKSASRRDRTPAFKYKIKGLDNSFTKLKCNICSGDKYIFRTSTIPLSKAYAIPNVFLAGLVSLFQNRTRLFKCQNCGNIKWFTGTVDIIQDD